MGNITQVHQATAIDKNFISSRLLPLLLMFLLMLCAGLPKAHAEDGPIAFDIPAGSLDAALSRLGRQAGILLSVNSDMTAGLTTNGLKGSYTVEEALKRLLSGTSLEAVRASDGSYSLQVVSQSSNEAVLPTMRVEGRAGGNESAYGSVEGYVASRSATGTKTDTAILDAPLSVQVITEDVMDDQSATRLSDVVRNVSGVQSDSKAGNRSDSFTIRGFHTYRVSRDGFLSPASFGDSNFVDLTNISKVEVLKGPASILYGQVEPGGLVNIVTKKPEADQFTDISGSYGSYDYKRLEFDINQSVNSADTLLSRLNVGYQSGGTFRENTVEPTQLIVAPSIRIHSDTATIMDLQFEYVDQERAYDRGVVTNDPDDLMILPRERYIGEPYSTVDAQDGRVRFVLDHQFNEKWSLRTLAQYTDSDQAMIAVNPVSFQVDQRTLNRNYQEVLWATEDYGFQFNLNGNVKSGNIVHEMLVGADVSRTDIDMNFDLATIDPIDIYNPVYGAQPGAITFSGYQKRDIDFYGIYFNDLISIGDNWKIMMGGRYDVVNTYYESNGNVITDDKRDEEFSPRAGVIYQPQKDLSLYASYSESFIPPLSGTSANGEEFKPEMGEQVEVGVKREWFDGRLLTTLSLFELSRKNLATEDISNPGFSIQLGEQRSRGIEMDISGEMRPWWHIIASFAWLDAVITKDNTYEEGNRLPNTPKLSSSVWSTYEFSEGLLANWELGGGIFFVGEREGSLDNSFTLPEYTTVDLLARYKINPDLQVSLNVKNLTDEYYIESSGGRLTWIEPGAPRTIILNVDWGL